ncbi:leucine-rich repeat domain-containing protein [Bacteroides sp.]|uniref:leucine-rich repeat domain-containing protein n=1 Tax=Bacteroides sp. TaxID=29523 RepID=UPI00261F94F3|nr:leucine-rich repeat domain-containing protein [Bacteroides sp.]MDD3036449.1 leucine-rich repeat domain-containing protein [Bacteroides sp.]
MKTTYLYTKIVFAIAVITLTLFSCSSHEDNSLLPNPEPPTDSPSEPTVEPDPRLQITDGVLTGITEAYEEIVLPTNVKRISKGVFYGKNIRKVTLNEGLQTIEENAFIFSTLEEINFPSSLKEIGKYAFYKCEKLASADLSKTKVKELPEGTFGYSGIQTITFPTTLETIGVQAFLNTSKLETIEIPTSVKSIEIEAFRECSATILSLPNNISFIASRVFYYCPNLQEVKTHGTVTQENPYSYIQAYCFEGCPELSTFTIPQNIRSLGQGLLGGNRKVKSITIPARVNRIAFSAFNNTAIENVIVEPASPPVAELASDIAWYGFPDNVKSIQVPNGTVENYKTAPGWKEFINKIQ